MQIVSVENDVGLIRRTDLSHRLTLLEKKTSELSGIVSSEKTVVRNKNKKRREIEERRKCRKQIRREEEEKKILINPTSGRDPSADTGNWTSIDCNGS